MLVINRFRIPASAAETFLVSLAEARDVLAEQKGYVDGSIGRNVDDTDLWVLQTRWENVGSYRRALSAYEVKLRAWPVLGQAIEEASAFEVLGEGGAEPNRVEPRSLG